MPRALQAADVDGVVADAVARDHAERRAGGHDLGGDAVVAVGGDGADPRPDLGEERRRGRRPPSSGGRGRRRSSAASTLGQHRRDLEDLGLHRAGSGGGWGGVGVGRVDRLGRSERRNDRPARAGAAMQSSPQLRTTSSSTSGWSSAWSSGLALARLLNGLARFVQHPARAAALPGPPACGRSSCCSPSCTSGGSSSASAASAPGASASTSSSSPTPRCTSSPAALLFPDRIDDYDGCADYFHARQGWFYGLLAAIFLVDIVDSALKGATHLRSLGAATRRGRSCSPPPASSPPASATAASTSASRPRPARSRSGGACASSGSTRVEAGAQAP